MTGEFPAQRASNVENVSILRRHHDIPNTLYHHNYVCVVSRHIWQHHVVTRKGKMCDLNSSLVYLSAIQSLLSNGYESITQSGMRDILKVIPTVRTRWYLVAIYCRTRLPKCFTVYTQVKFHQYNLMNNKKKTVIVSGNRFVLLNGVNSLAGSTLTLLWEGRYWFMCVPVRGLFWKIMYFVLNWCC